MARRRRRRRKKKLFPKIAGLVIFLALAAGAAASARYLLPEILKTAQETVGEAAGTASIVLEGRTEFPELTVSEEEAGDGFYFQQLTEREQTIYREILQGVNGMEEMIRIHATEEDDVGKIYEYLLYDRPELFWCAGNTSLTIYDEYTEVSPEYTCSWEEKEERQAQIDAAAQECLSGIDGNASDYEKIRYVYEYIVNTVEYDENAPDNQNIYSSMVGKRSVCAGYSRMAQYLLGQMGIPCIYVIGDIEGQGAHAWNIVNCGGTYYQMDTTFGDPVFLQEESGESIPSGSINYDYLCCTDEEIMVDHTQWEEVEYPACTSDDLNYYRMNGMYYDRFDPGELLQKMNDSVYAGEENFVCKFSDASVYSEARDAVINELLPQAAQNLASYYGLDSVSYTYAEDAEHCRIAVFWRYE
ncbi:hypothetical protein H6B11_15090 [Mediterraneibacter glycyrrhizinilyticus]|nr:transglutaminase domain-containing protein [Mediterraneibacter glycyrrhizinilyticus]MBM6855456.1 hypothetical protein [Mediterraneibacter glycyrrhizinilyticus]